jgi:hypothetical protein
MAANILLYTPCESVYISVGYIDVIDKVKQMKELEVVDHVVCEARSSSGHHGKSSGEQASWKQTEPQPQSS